MAHNADAVRSSTCGNRLVDLLCSVQVTFHGFMGEGEAKRAAGAL